MTKKIPFRYKIYAAIIAAILGSSAVYIKNLDKKIDQLKQQSIEYIKQTNEIRKEIKLKQKIKNTLDDDYLPNLNEKLESLNYIIKSIDKKFDELHNESEQIKNFKIVLIKISDDIQQIIFDINDVSEELYNARYILKPFEDDLEKLELEKYKGNISQEEYDIKVLELKEQFKKYAYEKLNNYSNYFGGYYSHFVNEGARLIEMFNKQEIKNFMQIDAPQINLLKNKLERLRSEGESLSESLGNQNEIIMETHLRISDLFRNLNL